MRKQRYFYWYFPALLITLLLFSCEEQTEWEFQDSENGALVVEAVITNELKKQEVFLSLSYDELNGNPVPATGAQIVITDGTHSIAFFPDAGDPGRYTSAIPFAAQLHADYTLEIAWNGETYLAKSSMTEVLPFNPVTFEPADDQDFMTIKDPPSLYSPHEQAMYEIDVYWFPVNSGDTPRAKLFYYTFNTIDISGVFRTEKETVVFPKNSIVIQKKYSLDSGFAAYLRALLIETEWQGGVFDEASANLPTNITNGGLGYFAVCEVLADTLIAE